MKKIIKFQNNNTMEKDEQKKYISNSRFCYKGNNKNTKCKKVVLNNRTFNKIVSETFSYATDETGGIFIGYIVNGDWYITDSIDAGIVEKTTHTNAFFKYDEMYVNHQINKQRVIYKYEPYILGFWHRHPLSFDMFSTEDEKTMKEHCELSKHGILSMLVNIDPELRMTFYYASKNNQLFNVKYEIGDDLIPNELNELASYETITKRFNNKIKLKEYGILVDASSPSKREESNIVKYDITEYEEKSGLNNMVEEKKLCESSMKKNTLDDKKLLSRIAKMEANRYTHEERVVIPEELLNENKCIEALYGFMPDTGVYTVISGNEGRKITGSELIGYKVASKDEIDKIIKDVTKKMIFVYEDRAYIYDVKTNKIRNILVEPYSLIQNLTSRHSGLLEVNWMKDSTAIISGCGSVGSLVAVQLARAGVGNIVLMDPEILEIHNICRHQLTLMDIGKQKVDAIGEKINHINPNCNVRTFARPFQEVPLSSYDEMIINKDKTIFIGTCDNRIGNANVCKMATGLGCAFAAIGFFPRAWGTEIFTMLPGELEYDVVFKKQIIAAAIEERDNHLYLDEKDKGKVSFVPGLDVDIEYGTSLFDKVVLDIINRNNINYKMRIYNQLSSQFTLLAGTTDIPDTFYRKCLEPFVPTSVELSDEFYKMNENS